MSWELSFSRSISITPGITNPSVLTREDTPPEVLGLYRPAHAISGLVQYRFHVSLYTLPRLSGDVSRLSCLSRMSPPPLLVMVTLRWSAVVGVTILIIS